MNPFINSYQNPLKGRVKPLVPNTYRYLGPVARLDAEVGCSNFEGSGFGGLGRSEKERKKELLIMRICKGCLAILLGGPWNLVSKVICTGRGLSFFVVDIRLWAYRPFGPKEYHTHLKAPF